MHAAERVPGRLPVLAPTGREVCVCACVRVCVLACVRACVLRAGDSGAPTLILGGEEDERMVASEDAPATFVTVEDAWEAGEKRISKLNKQMFRSLRGN